MKELRCCYWRSLYISVWSQKEPLDIWFMIAGKLSVSVRSALMDAYLTYAINPQEGDGVLVIQSSDNSWKRKFPAVTMLRLPRTISMWYFVFVFFQGNKRSKNKEEETR